MKRFLFFLFCLVYFSASAQDLTGIWRGNFNSNNGRLLEMLGQDSRYKFEVQLDQRNKAFEGVTYSYLTTVFYGKASCKGTVNPQTKKVLLEELRIVEVRMSNGSTACIMTCFLQYSKIGEEEFLEGTYSSMNVTDSTNCGRGTVFLRKVITSDFYKEPFLLKREEEKEREASKKPGIKKTDSALVKTTPLAKTKSTPKKTVPAKKPVVKKTTPSTVPKNSLASKPPANKPVNKPPVNKPVTKPPVKTVQEPPIHQTDPKTASVDTVKKLDVKPHPVTITPKVLVERENELVKTIITKANEIVINIYDNGAIDNDTVSVYLDKKLVLSNKRLTDKALTLKFELNDEVDYHELVMVAENLGDIPPNTSLMVVHAGNKQYEVRITSTEQKNAVVIFKYDKSK